MSAEKPWSRLCIDGDLTIQNAAATREQLLVALGGNDAVEVDLAGVSEFDCAGVQLLVAAKKSAAAAGKLLRLAGPSRPVVDVLEFLGLLDELAGPPATETRHES